MSDSQIKIQELERPYVSSSREDVKTVNWNSLRRDKRGVALIGTEYFNDNKQYVELYADGTVIYIDRLKRQEYEKKIIDFNILENAVNDFKNKRKNIKIRELAEKSNNI